MFTFRRLLALLIVTALLPAPALAATKLRSMKLAWKTIEGAAKYEVQLSRNARMEPVFERKTVPSAAVPLDLPPGTYFYRVRGVDSSGAVGPWSDVDGFTVNPAPPRCLEPVDGTLFKSSLPDGKLRLRWEKGWEGSGYALEITDDKGTVLRRSVEGTAFDWKPGDPGTYRWRVAFDSPGAPDWGASRVFTVEQSALPAPKVLIETRTVVQTVVKTRTVVKEVAATESITHPHFWDALFSVGGNISSYSAQSAETASSGGGTAIGATYRLEGRWGGARMAERDWTPVLDVGFGVDGTSLFGTGLSLLDGEAVLGWERRFSQWALEPAIEARFGQTPAVVLDSGSAGDVNKITREGAGAGLKATYYFGRGLSAVAGAFLREDFGGGVVFSAASANASLGYDGRLSLLFRSNASWLFQSSLDFVGESVGWAPAQGSSSTGRTAVGLNLGVGYQF